MRAAPVRVEMPLLDHPPATQDRLVSRIVVLADVVQRGCVQRKGATWLDRPPQRAQERLVASAAEVAERSAKAHREVER
jgi:hypothetical protein